MASKYPFFKDEMYGLRKQVTFVGDEMKIYLPTYFLEKDSVFAKSMGNRIETIGLFWFKVKDKFYELSFPANIQFEYSNEDTFSGKLKPELPKLDYKIFILNKGDAFIYDTAHIQKLDDLETMLIKVVDQGKMPPTVSYSESIQVLLNLLVASGYGTGLRVSSAILEILLSELYRDKYAPSKPFRILLGNSKASDYDFILVKLSRIPELSSTFNSLMGEDLSTELDNIVVRNRKGTKDRESPMEKLVKM